MEYYSAIKKKEFASCNNMVGRIGYYVRWNKSDDIIYTYNLKNKLVNITKRNRLIDIEINLVG